MAQKQYNSTNVFARIISKEIPANIVLEDEHSIAFYDINPQATVHIVAIPKSRCTDFEDFVSRTGGDVEFFFKFIVKVVKKVGLTNYRLVTNRGSFAGQSVFHFHIHILSGELSEKLVG